MTRKFSSIITNNKTKCYICGRQHDLKNYLIINTDTAIRDGLYVMLCTDHEEIIGKNKDGTVKKITVQGCYEFEKTHPKENKLLKGIARDKWINHYHMTKNDWNERYGDHIENCS